MQRTTQCRSQCFHRNSASWRTRNASASLAAWLRASVGSAECGCFLQSARISRKKDIRPSECSSENHWRFHPQCLRLGSPARFLALLALHNTHLLPGSNPLSLLPIPSNSDHVWPSPLDRTKRSGSDVMFWDRSHNAPHVS